MRHLVGLLIGSVLLLLLFGIYSVIAAVPDAEPFGYGASGIGLVALASGLGLLVVLLLRLLIAWRRLGAPAHSAWPARPTQPGLRRYWLILLTGGWAGTFLVSIGILRGWDWMVVLLGSLILVFAGRATHHLARLQPPVS